MQSVGDRRKKEVRILREVARTVSLPLIRDDAGNAKVREFAETIEGHGCGRFERWAKAGEEVRIESPCPAASEIAEGEGSREEPCDVVAERV